MENTTQNIDDIRQNKKITDFQKTDSETKNEMLYIKNLYTLKYKKYRKFLQDANVHEKLNKVIQFFKSNPLLLVGIVIITSILIIPILLFTIFAVVNVAITFTSFIIIEVMLLMIGMTVLCCVMFFIIAAVMIFGIFLIVSTYVIYVSFSIIKRKLYSK